MRIRVSLLLAIALLSACGGSATPPPSEAPRPAPDFALADLEGKLVRLSDSAGKVRLIDFWATWCAPCREAIPDLKELDASYRDQGLTVLGISMDDPSNVVGPFVKDFKIPYPTLLGNDEVAQAFGGIVGLPTTFLVDREGRITDTYVGGTPKDVFESRIRELLGLPKTG